MRTLNKMKIKQMRASGFTLVEIMIVVAIIGLLIAVAVPNFSKMRKDAQRTACHAQLKQIDGSKEMWATQEKRADGDTPSEAQIGEYIQDGMPSCPGGGTYTIAAVGQKATCTAHGTMGQQ
jgi:prepilin-type N-terminal cleavage/methylation domain-containing protein